MRQFHRIDGQKILMFTPNSAGTRFSAVEFKCNLNHKKLNWPLNLTCGDFSIWCTDGFYYGGGGSILSHQEDGIPVLNI